MKQFGRLGRACTGCLTALTLLLGTVSSDGVAEAAPLANGNIVFVTELGFGLDIYLFDPHTRRSTRLTSEGENMQPAWSPTGSAIAFSARRFPSTTFGIYVMASNGTGERRLSSGGDFKPTWSPDGTKIAFGRGDAAEFDVWVMNADGSDQIRVTRDPAREGAPAWSPDGRRIAFVSFKHGNAEIHVINADGANEVRLTSNPAPDVTPAWSPDARRLLFISERDGNREVYVMDADGTNQRRLTRDAAIDSNPAWSPDGRFVLFDRVRNPELEGPDILVMNADGTRTRVLIDVGAGIHADPEWQPAPDLSVALLPRSATGRLSRKLSYSIIVRNRSSILATDVTLTHSLAQGVRFISASPSRGRCSRVAPMTCLLGKVTFPRPAVVRLRVRAVRIGRFSHSSFVSGRETEAGLANNRAIGRLRVGR